MEAKTLLLVLVIVAFGCCCSRHYPGIEGGECNEHGSLEPGNARIISSSMKEGTTGVVSNDKDSIFLLEVHSAALQKVFNCTAFALDENIIATASHCVENRAADQIRYLGRGLGLMNTNDQQVHDDGLFIKSNYVFPGTALTIWNGNNALLNKKDFPCYYYGISGDVSEEEYDHVHKSQQQNLKYDDYRKLMVPGQMARYNGTCTFTKNNQIKMKISIFGGVSGSPLFVDSSGGSLVIGIVSGYDSTGENLAVLFPPLFILENNIQRQAYSDPVVE
eukprot:TRINITY_DN3394_c0_g1_i1.p1 TRINITY_DN3394_c0_g1~~TRINITY_DN3394_c0_g1_i1.p1  ORF type:complete len:276 (+),score=68.45 TRINITY_DN3394_c0_g1_i1:332-1159(+)